MSGDILTKAVSFSVCFLCAFAAQELDASGGDRGQATQKSKAARIHAGGKKAQSVHGNSWAFGQSADRNSDLWIKGVNGENIPRHAVPKVDKKAAADTAKGINAAISNAERKPKGSLGLKMKNETSDWKVTPSQKNWHHDESIAREGKHVLGAYAGLHASDYLDINVGPELILKDDQNVRESSNKSQPDSALGLGMNFKLDF